MVEELMSQRFLIAMGVGAFIGSVVAALTVMVIRWREERAEPELEHLDIRGRRWEPMRLGIIHELQVGDLILYHDTWQEIVEVQSRKDTRGGPTVKFLLQSKSTLSLSPTKECIMRVLKGRPAPEDALEELDEEIPEEPPAT